MKILSDSVLEKLKSILVVIDNKGNLEYVSSSVKSVLGYSPEQLLGGNWIGLISYNKNEFKYLRTGLRKISSFEKNLHGLSYEQHFRTAFGNEKWILWTASSENCEKLIAIGQDITERKKGELALKQKNRELNLQQIETKQSFEYARRLQAAILPDISVLGSWFNGAFVFYKPKDIIGGDYYYFHKSGNKVFVVAVDCTGHGVPGALLSIVANSLIKEVILNQAAGEPADLLFKLDNELHNVINSKKDAEINYDGMDAAIGIIDTESYTLSFSGAFRPLLLTRRNQILEYNASRYPIGFYADIEKKFVSHTIQLEKGDELFFFTDGFCSQFGGEENKKFNRRRFRELLLFVQSLEIDEQESFLNYSLNNWRQNESQTDDILILGLKI